MVTATKRADGGKTKTGTSMLILVEFMLAEMWGRGLGVRMMFARKGSSRFSGVRAFEVKA